MLAHLIRTVVHTQARLLAWAADRPSPVPVAGPFEVIVAVPDSAGLVLGGLNDGWQEPGYDGSPSCALDNDILVRLQVDDWPTSDDDLDSLAVAVLERAAHAFGDRGQRYRSRTGPAAGTMQPSYA